MPHGAGHVATGLAAADTIGVGLVAILLSGKARQARREARELARARAEVKARAELAAIQARHERMIDNSRAVHDAIIEANATVTANMHAQTEFIERVVDWPGDLPGTAPIPVPEPRVRPRPYVLEQRPRVLARMQAHRK